MESVNWADLSDKMKCLMEFAKDACGKEDWFLVSTNWDVAEAREKTICLKWFCTELCWNDAPDAKDKRDHEAILRQYFASYHLTIEKKSGRWVIFIATPQPSDTASVKVVLKSNGIKRSRDH